jgi:hypothetical protein
MLCVLCRQCHAPRCRGSSGSKGSGAAPTVGCKWLELTGSRGRQLWNGCALGFSDFTSPSTAKLIYQGLQEHADNTVQQVQLGAVGSSWAGSAAARPQQPRPPLLEIA